MNQHERNTLYVLYHTSVPKSCGYERKSIFICAPPLSAIICPIWYTDIWIIIMSNSICAYWLVLQLCGTICLGIPVLRIARIKVPLNSAAKYHLHYLEMCPVINQVHHSWHMKGERKQNHHGSYYLVSAIFFEGFLLTCGHADFEFCVIALQTHVSVEIERFCLTGQRRLFSFYCIK